ncbi:putative membrane protein [Lysobacter antibioticus]|nr:putative membrane protein [Lysobacter antibioticus]
MEIGAGVAGRGRGVAAMPLGWLAATFIVLLGSCGAHSA